MLNCEHSGLSIPECACNRCIERQLEQFAPELLKLAPELLKITPRHDPLLLKEARSTSPLAPVSERLSRPVL